MTQAETGNVTTKIADAALPPLERGASVSAHSDRALLWYLLVLATPVIGEQLLSMTVGLTDVWLAGHLGKQSADATAAVGSISYFLWLIGLITGTINAGSTAIIARATGARHRSLANKVCGQSVTAAMLMGLALGAMLFVFAEPVARFTGLPEGSRELALLYLRILSFSLPFSTIIFAGNACLRGAGDTYTPAVVMITVDGTNALLSASLTRGLLGLPALGYRGIAIGTLCAYVVGGTLLLAVLFSGRRKLRLFPHRMPPNWVTMKRVLRIGVPSGVEGVLSWGAQFVILNVITRAAHGSVAGAAHAVAIRVESFSFLIGFAIAIATATAVGQSLGAKNPARANRAAWLAFRVGGGFMTTLGVLFILTPRTFTGLLTSDPRVADLAARCIVPAGFAQIGFAAALIFGGALRGAGDTLNVMRITLVSVFSLRLVGVLIVGGVFKLGLPAIWIVLCSELMIRGGLIFAHFLRGRWKRVEV
jgi:putative MATE family efflux protein